MTPVSLSLAIVFAALSATAFAAKPHEHGAARLDVAVEPGRITFELEAPLDNLLGFERVPRNDAERQQADAMVTALKAADVLFRIDPAAQCRLAKVELASAALKLGQAASDAAEGHADLDGEFVFDCRNAARAGFVELALFDAFPRLQRLDVQVVMPKGQLKRTLKRGATRLTLVR